jgi:hypothetical protein
LIPRATAERNEATTAYKMNSQDKPKNPKGGLRKEYRASSLGKDSHGVVSLRKNRFIEEEYL